VGNENQKATNDGAAHGYRVLGFACDNAAKRNANIGRIWRIKQSLENGMGYPQKGVRLEV